jgi:hypothetical protein
MKTLENIRIASPCRADWNEMTGDDRTRTCATCAKQVFNLSEMTRAEAEAVIAEKHGNLCARYYQRADGTIMLADCTVGGSGARARSFVLATALAAGAVYAKLHRGSPPSEATAIGTANDEVPTGVRFTSSSHDGPPPPRDLEREVRERAIRDANERRKREKKLEEEAAIPVPMIGHVRAHGDELEEK